jgi:hypothetical protein
MVVIGRAMPVLSVDVFAEKISGSANMLMGKSCAEHRLSDLQDAGEFCCRVSTRPRVPA